LDITTSKNIIVNVVEIGFPNSTNNVKCRGWWPNVGLTVDFPGAVMSFRHDLFAITAATIVIGLGTTVHAQQTPVDPGRLDERLRERPALPTVTPVEIPLLPDQEAGPDSALSVTLTGVVFEGATSVPLDVLNAIAAPYLGRTMPLSGVFQLGGDITAEYRRRGYVLSRAVIGPQRLENGVVTIQILEGYIDSARIEGEAGGYRPYLERYLAPVTQSRPTDGAVLSRALLLARDLNGLDVRSVITPSATQAAAADLSLVVERNPYSAYVAIDNRASRWLGPVQVYAGVSLNDALGLGERISASVVAAPDDNELGFVALDYRQPLGGSGLRMSAFTSYARTEPGDELRVLGVEGKSVTGGIGLEYPFIRGRDVNVIGRTTFVGRNAESSNDLVDPIFKDRLRTLSFELVGNYADPMGGLTSGRIGLTRGLDGFGSTDDSDPDKSRATGSAQFTRVNFEMSRVQPLVGDIYIQVAFEGQASSDSLLASEEFGLGGAGYGRAFDPSEITGDSGLAGKIELFQTTQVGGLSSVEPYVYYETGFVRQEDPLPGESPRDNLASAGVGVRVAFNPNVTASLEYAKPLERDVASRADRDGRVFFSLSASF